MMRILNSVSMGIAFGLVFILVVVPVGLIRRAMGKDPLQLRSFKKGRKSVLVNRAHTYEKEDLLNTF